MRKFDGRKIELDDGQGGMAVVTLVMVSLFGFSAMAVGTYLF